MDTKHVDIVQPSTARAGARRVRRQDQKWAQANIDPVSSISLHFGLTILNKCLARYLYAARFQVHDYHKCLVMTNLYFAVW